MPMVSLVNLLKCNQIDSRIQIEILKNIGGGKRATRLTIAIALAIWLLAIMCGLPALIATHVKVCTYIFIQLHNLNYTY